jgi:hypothetical protein
MSPQQYEFLTACWVIVRKLGKENVSAAARAQVAWGLDAEGARVYADNLIEIVGEAEPSQRILVTKLDTKNPIVCTDKDGNPYRWHGETGRMAAHVRLLAAGLRDEPPEASSGG